MQARAGKTPAAEAQSAKLLRMFAERESAAGQRPEPSVTPQSPPENIVQSLLAAQKHDVFRSVGNLLVWKRVFRIDCVVVSEHRISIQGFSDFFYFRRSIY